MRGAAAVEATPREHAISREETQLLWRALESMPETYRIPMILFYREGRSVAAVAETLGITPAAAKERLYRGRKLLKQEMATVVETALDKTRPGEKLARAIVAALPTLTPGLGKTTAAAPGSSMSGAGPAIPGTRWAQARPAAAG